MIQSLSMKIHEFCKLIIFHKIFIKKKLVFFITTTITCLKLIIII